MPNYWLCGRRVIHKWSSPEQLQWYLPAFGDGLWAWYCTWSITYYFNSLWTVSYRLNKMSQETQEQTPRKISVVWLNGNAAHTELGSPCPYNWTLLLHEMLTNLSIRFWFSISSCTCTCLSIISITLISSSLSLPLPLSKGQLVCFPSEGKRNFLTWRKRSGTDTNMVCLWHKLHSNLLFLHLFFVYFPLPPSLPHCTSLPAEHVKHIGGGCLEACAYALSTYGYLSVQWMGLRNTTLHVSKCNRLLCMSIMWSGITAYLCS